MQKLIFTTKNKTGECGDFVINNPKDTRIYSDEITFTPLSYPRWGRRYTEGGKLICSSNDKINGNRFKLGASGKLEKTGDPINCSKCQYKLQCQYVVTWVVLPQEYDEPVVWDVSYDEGFKKFAPITNSWKEAIIGLKENSNHYIVIAKAIQGKRNTFYSIKTDRKATEEEIKKAEAVWGNHDAEPEKKSKQSFKKTEPKAESKDLEDDDLPI